MPLLRAIAVQAADLARKARRYAQNIIRYAMLEGLRDEGRMLEARLAHAKRGEVQAAYDCATFTEARREAMQGWADWLDRLALDAKVAPGQGNAAA